MMVLPEGRKSFKIVLAVLVQYRRVTDSQPASHSHVAVACTRYAYLRRAVKTEQMRVTWSVPITFLFFFITRAAF